MARHQAADGQLDMLALIPVDRPAAGSIPCLFRSPARGLRARGAEFLAWERKHRRAAWAPSHAWGLASCCLGDPTDRCQATVMWADLSHYTSNADLLDCDCTTAVDDMLYRGACRGCDWEAPGYHDSENAAAEDAVDHAWPGWRDLPVVKGQPYDHKAEQRWLARVIAQYPAGWLEAGGPIRTARASSLGCRHVPNRLCTGGYDMAVLVPEDKP